MTKDRTLTTQMKRIFSSGIPFAHSLIKFNILVHAQAPKPVSTHGVVKLYHFAQCLCYVSESGSEAARNFNDFSSFKLSKCFLR